MSKTMTPKRLHVNQEYANFRVYMLDDEYDRLQAAIEGRSAEFARRLAAAYNATREIPVELLEAEEITIVVRDRKA